MEFEFDDSKSKKNLEKHGIDFIQAQSIWKDWTYKIIAPHPVEERYLIIGQIGGVYWTAIITYREDKIRIISVRRSRIMEKREYENNRRENDRQTYH